MNLDESKCFFCGSSLSHTSPALDVDGYFYNCPLCGKYIITEYAQADFNGALNNKRHLVAGYLHSQIGKSKETLIIKRDNAVSFFENAAVPQNAMEKLNNILVYFYKMSDSVGKEYRIEDYNNKPTVFFAEDKNELAIMMDELSEIGWIETKKKFYDNNNYLPPIGNFRLTTQGLMKAFEILASPKFSKKVFVAMGFKDDLLIAKDEAIKPACRNCGFDAEVVTQNHNEDITYKIIAEIKESRFVVCDLTYNNHGAYYEAGFARGLGLPVIFCCNRDWFDGNDEKGIKNKLHFDIEHINTIFWKTHDDLREQLEYRIRATIL